LSPRPRLLDFIDEHCLHECGDCRRVPIGDFPGDSISQLLVTG
jgi:hypothetical protein